MKIIFSVITVLFTLLSNSLAASPFWTDINHKKKINNINTPRFININHQQLHSMLTLYNPDNQQIELTLPLPNNTTIAVILSPITIMENRLAKQYPSIKVWAIKGKKDKRIQGVIDTTPLGFHAMIYMPDKQVYIIDPKYPSTKNKQRTPIQLYVSQKTKAKRSVLARSPLQCQAKTIPTPSWMKAAHLTLQSKETLTRNKITYRIAIAATGEYTRYFGNKTLALASIVTHISRINQIYLRDLNIQLQLVNNNGLLIFDDPVNDPFTPSIPAFVVDQSIELMSKVIGNQHFDIGHVFGQGNSYGVAFTGSVCQENFKAGGYSSSSNPIGDVFSVDYVAHEIGHQLGAKHSFNAETSSCSGGTRNGSTAIEPGSGSSIMSYAGICRPNNIVEHSDPMFNIVSIGQIENYTRSANGKLCGNRSAINTNHHPEIIHLTPHSIIPANTAFSLTGSAIDIDFKETLTYSWEQVDTGRPSDLNIDNGGNPLFRIYLPTFNSTRDFPSTIKQQNSQAMTGEFLPTTNRNMTFKLVVRDNHGGLTSKQTNIQVITNNNQAFMITSNTPLLAKYKARIKWKTANTELPPFNCKQVDIRLSDDQGAHYPYLLADKIPNNGSIIIDMPNIKLGQNARLKLQCSNNIFFSVTQAAKVGNDTINLIPINNQTTIETSVTNVDTTADTNTNGFSSKPDNTNTTPKKNGSSLSLYYLLILCGFILRRNHALG